MVKKTDYSKRIYFPLWMNILLVIKDELNMMKASKVSGLAYDQIHLACTNFVNLGWIIKKGDNGFKEIVFTDSGIKAYNCIKELVKLVER